MDYQDLCFLTIAQTSKLIASRELSPVDVVEAHLNRIEDTDGRLNSFITLLADQANLAARAAEVEIEGRINRGPLHGVPIGLKDLYYTKGIRTTMGSKVLAEFVPDYDATVTRCFYDAGAILMGKLQMHEFALGGTSLNPHYGPAHNPWDITRITGGSSGGSGSAVAAGQVMGALGSDTGGSVRIPAGLCGITGLKPTFGRVSRHGVYPLAWSLDTVGPMTRTAEDAALIMNAIAGHDPQDPASADRPSEDFTQDLEEGVKGLRIGIPREYFFDIIDPEVEAAVRQAANVLDGLGAKVEEVSIPALDLPVSISSPILSAEAAEALMDHMRDRPDDLDPQVLNRLKVGAAIPAVQYLKAQRARTAFNRQIADQMKQVDLLLSATEPAGAPPIDAETMRVGDAEELVGAMVSRLTRPYNIGGLPAITVPCGFTSEDLPIGLQLAGRAFADSLVLRAAHAYQQATDWHTRRPPV